MCDQSVPNYTVCGLTLITAFGLHFLPFPYRLPQSLFPFQPFGKNDRQFSVVFVATLEGRLQKLVSLDSSSSSPSQHCLVEDIALFPSIEELKRSGGQKSIGIEGLGIGNGRGGGRVLTLKLDAEENAVIVGTETAVIKVPFERCHRHETRTLCVAAQGKARVWGGGVFSHGSSKLR